MKARIKVLHILDHFFPVTSGYTFRTGYMLESQKRVLGVEPVVLTAPQHSDLSSRGGEWKGIRTYATTASRRLRTAMPVVKEIGNMLRLHNRVVEVATREKVDVLHAHSPVLNAWPALSAGRKLGLPVVYEIRAFWEDAAVLHGSTTQDSLRYRVTRMIETAACKRARAVVTICEGLKKQLLERKIAARNVFVLPNGVDPEKFQPGKSPRRVLERLGLQDRQVVGFIGSLYRYEGLSIFVEAMAALSARFPRLQGLIVGQGFGCEVEELKEQARRLGVEDRILFTGKVPHEEIGEYYSAIDILVYPRVRSRLLELVTPLKILEAMALEKAVIGSDVGGIREIIRDGENGRLFPADDPAALAGAITYLLENPSEIERLGRNGRRYVLEQRGWDMLIESHREAYRHIGLKV